MNGVPVTPRRRWIGDPGRQPLSVPIGAWRSGLYFARLEAPDGRVGFAPFVVALAGSASSASRSSSPR